MIATTAISRLNKVTRDDGTPDYEKSTRAQEQPVVYLYFDYRVDHEQTFRSAVAAVLRQIARINTDAYEKVGDFYQNRYRETSHPSEHDSIEMLSEVCRRSISGLYLIMDGLDECRREDSRRLVPLFAQLKEDARIKLLVIARPLPDIIRMFFGAPSLHVRASDEDLGKYIAGRHQELPDMALKDSRLCRRITSTIISASDGL